MVRKSKYQGKVVFIDDPYLRNSRGDSPYACITSVEKTEGLTDPNANDMKTIQGFDLRGREFEKTYHKGFMYAKFEIMTQEEQHHLFEDFIKVTFGG